MHIQARVSLRRAAAETGEDGADPTAISARYEAGGLAAVLRVLEREGFDLESAGGRQIELGGEFAFAVRARDKDRDHEAATQAAVELLATRGYEARTVTVHSGVLDDRKGALLRFVQEVAHPGVLIEEIAIGAASEPGRVPVQIYTAEVGAAVEPQDSPAAAGTADPDSAT